MPSARRADIAVVNRAHRGLQALGPYWEMRVAVSPEKKAENGVMALVCEGGTALLTSLTFTIRWRLLSFISRVRSTAWIKWATPNEIMG